MLIFNKRPIPSGLGQNLPNRWSIICVPAKGARPKQCLANNSYQSLCMENEAQKHLSDADWNKAKLGKSYSWMMDSWSSSILSLQILTLTDFTIMSSARRLYLSMWTVLQCNAPHPGHPINVHIGQLRVNMSTQQPMQRCSTYNCASFARRRDCQSN